MGELTPFPDWIDSGDPDRPYDGNYADLAYVPWYARMSAEQRLRYLEWRIAALKAEHRAHVKARVAAGNWLAKYEFFPKLEDVRLQHRIEVADREPLPAHHRGRENYRNYLDSMRWKRTRLRKLVAVNWRCEFPGCAQPADECHHLHYETVGFEHNADLDALCSLHHQARHGIT